MGRVSHRGIALRPGRAADLDALAGLEHRVFDYDRMSRQSIRRFLASPSAAVIVVEDRGQFAGYALVLFRPRSLRARLYSIAVEPERTGRGIGSRLLDAAEDAARRRGATVLRLEVQETNAAAIRQYRKARYIETGRRLGYFTDGGNALRFEKPLSQSSTAEEDSASPPRPR